MDFQKRGPKTFKQFCGIRRSFKYLCFNHGLPLNRCSAGPNLKFITGGKREKQNTVVDEEHNMQMKKK